ncbi:MAG: 16S rRNA (cytosine(967)-C(5))-methyltransferase RsmB [Lachnospiraceae bacterium]|nr:16S rRNA (cytosine(967)-C(5))-methyltransferase RsmB [Lachnospiraceae bacterium]
MTKPVQTAVPNPRGVALDILIEILEKDSLSHLALRRGLKAHPEYDKQQRAFLTRLVEGTVERRLEMDYIIGRYSSVPMKKMKPVIRNILRMGVYQLLYMDAVPDSAVCNESVKLATKRGFTGLKGFVNGLLRKVATEKDRISYPDESTAEGLSVRYSMPQWLVDSWLAAYGLDQTRQMLQAVLTERPLIVHHNQSGCDAESVRDSLTKQRVDVQSHPYSSDAWILRGVDHLDALEAFAKGWIQPQDISSQLTSFLAVHAMKDRWRQVRQIECVQSALKILDVCAAPGGKSLYIADAAKALSIPATVLSRDLTEDKTAMIEENRRRLYLENLQVQTYDALVYDPAWENQADVIVADLPCSGLGIMGRKNDIKYRMTPQIQQELADLQRQILSVIWRYIKPGGYLLYSTCTINPAENDDNFHWIQENYPFRAVDIRPWLPEILRTDSAASGSLQLLPGVHDSDGFYLTALQRI